MSVERVIPILKLVEKEEITATVRKDIDKDITETDRQASNNLKKKRRPPLNFTEMNIPIGPRNRIINFINEFMKFAKNYDIFELKQFFKNKIKNGIILNNKNKQNNNKYKISNSENNIKTKNSKNNNKKN